MSSWKIGYPNGLDSVASVSIGKALYDPFSVSAITLSSKLTTERGSGQVTGIAETILTDTGNFTTDQFNGGFLKMLSGSAKGKAYKVTDTTTNTLVVKDMDGSAATMSSDGVGANDYYEVVTGSTTFVFPAQRNPVRKDIKIVNTGNYERYPYYEGGIAISYGRAADDIVILGYLTSEADFKSLFILLGLKMTYGGYDGVYTPVDQAPLVLETGTADADHQFLVYCKDVKKIRDGKKGSIIEVMMHFEQISLISYRGF